MRLRHKVGAGLIGAALLTAASGCPWRGGGGPSTTTTTTSTTVLSSTTTTMNMPMPTTTTAAPGTTAPTPITITTTPPEGVQFSEDFSGKATLEQLFADFDFGIARTAAPVAGQTWRGDHAGTHTGTDCGGANPGDQRTVAVGEEIWLCQPNANVGSAHVMLSVDNLNGGYGVAALSPKRFFTGRKVCWRVNLTFEDRSHWWEMQLVPRAAYEARNWGPAPTLPDGRIALNYVPYQQGAPIYFGTGGPSGSNFGQGQRILPAGSLTADWTGSQLRVWQGGDRLIFDPGGAGGPEEQFRTTDHSARPLHCMVDNGNGTITVTQQRPGQADYVRTFAGTMPAEYKLIFSVQNYNAEKHTHDGNIPPLGEPGAFATWHLDDWTAS